MRTIDTRVWIVAVGLAVLAACGGGDGDDECYESLLGTRCPSPPVVTCVSWENRVVRSLVEGFTLNPDYSYSPPRAEIAIGQRFAVGPWHPNRHPPDCTLPGPGGPSYYGWGTTDDAVLASEGHIFVGVGSGTARVIVDMPTPSGSREDVELTVCSEPGADEESCPNRVPLDIRVVP